MKRRNKRRIKRIITYISLIMCIIFVNVASRKIVPYGSGINVVSGTSMYPTLEDGQVIFSDDTKEIERADIVTSHFPPHMVDREEDLMVKRVIGIPGDELFIDTTGVYIDGQKLEEDYLTEEAKENSSFGDRVISITLQENEYFLMGDNREVSSDSRSFGVVTKDRILYAQTEAPNRAFWLKTVLFIVTVGFGIILYGVMRVILFELYLWYRRRRRVLIKK